jgi:hypothetical protein
MHSMSNFNKLQYSYQVLEKNSRLHFLRKKSSKTHKKCLNKFFWSKFFTTNTLSTNVHKCVSLIKTKCPIVIQNVSKNEISKNFGPLMEHGPH